MKYRINIDWQEIDVDTKDNPNLEAMKKSCRIVEVEAKDFDEALKKANKLGLNSDEQEDLNRFKSGTL